MFKILLLLIALASPLSSTYADIVAQGYVQARLNNDELESETGVGLSVDVNRNVDFRFIGSLVTNTFDNEPRANILLFDLHTDEENLGVRIGRVQNELGFYTAQLNWVPARDMYMAPQGIYRENFRYMRRSGDGIQPYMKINTSYATHELTFTYTHRGVIYPMEDVTKAWSSVGGTINIDKSKNYGISYNVNVKPLKTDFRWDFNALKIELEGTKNKGFYDGGVDTNSNYFGSRTYITDKLDLTLEYLHIKKTGDTFEKMDYVSSKKGYYKTLESAEAYGISVGYQVNDLIKVLTGWSAFYSTPSDKYSDEIKKTGANVNNTYTEDQFLAIKYRKDYIIITGEGHFMKGTTTLNKRDSDKIKDPYHQIYILTLTYLFQ